MEKSKLERFIAKYNLGGSCERVKFVSDGAKLSVRTTPDDKNVVVEEVSCKDMAFPTGEFGIYDTRKLRSMLGVLGDTLQVVVNQVDNKSVGLNITDDSTKVTFVLADESVIPVAPVVKKEPPFEVEIMLNEKFISTFSRAKGALPEVNTFTVMSTGVGTDVTVLIGYSKSNTNRVNIAATASVNAKLDTISFSANQLKEMLMANKEFSNGVLKVSSKGIASASFSGDGFVVRYYLFKMDSEN